MNRWLLFASLCCGVALIAGPSARAQVNDRVIYIDRTAKPDPKKGLVPKEETGEVTAEDANAVKITPKVGGPKTIPAADVKDIVYDTRITGISKIKSSFNEAVKGEQEAVDTTKGTAAAREKALKTAIDTYQAVLDSGEKFTPPFKRHLEYKIINLKLLQAAGNKAKEEALMKDLAAWKGKHGNSWQITGCLDRLGELQLAHDDYKGAAATFGEALKLAGISDETKGKYRLQEANALIKANDFGTAQKRIEDILKGMKEDDPQYFPLKMRLITCKAATPEKVNEALKDLDSEIKKIPETDKGKKAVAHNTRGDCFLLSKDRKGEALYDFLAVEVMYPANEQELSKAYSELTKIYTERRQEARAKEYQEKLAKLRSGK